MEERLKKNDEIRLVFDKGIPYRCKSINIYLLKKDDLCPTNRAAFVVRKKLHNKKAVLRNRLRRVLREAYRKTKHILPRGYDIVILGMNIAKKTKSTEIEKELRGVFKKVL